MPATLYHGAIVHSLSLTKIEYLTKGLIYVSPEGIIEWIEKDVDGSMVQEVALSHGVVLGDQGAGVEVVELGADEFLCPGLIDTHTHAPQYPNNGLGQQYQLLDWLENLTFPQEAKFSDVEYAQQIYGEVVKRNLNAGTTTCCYYATLHEEASVALADIVLEKGQRGFIGKCNMDQNCPSTYTETTESSCKSTQNFVDHFQTYPPDSLVQPILTPRFAISCTPEILTFLSKLSKSITPSIAIQTHLSENLAEIEYVKKLFPEGGSYAGVYEMYGLLGEGTILAHCVHLSQEEREIIKKCGAGISHCPVSNLNLNSGAARVAEMLEMGIKVGLGTDCSGGYSSGILSALRAASTVSKTLSFLKVHDHPPLSIETLFHMATLGGASLCRLDNEIGNFQPGKEFDALRVRAGGSPGMWIKDGETVEERFEKWLFTGDDRDLVDVWVRGMRVGGV